MNNLQTVLVQRKQQKTFQKHFFFIKLASVQPWVENLITVITDLFFFLFLNSLLYFLIISNRVSKKYLTINIFN